jgi:Porin PorA
VRRSAAFALLIVGLTVFFLAPLARWYVLPRVKKIPADYTFRAVSVGMGTYLDPSKGFLVVGPVRLQNIHLVKGDVAASTPNVAVWDSFDSTFDVANHHELSYSIDRYTFDRHTALSVRCCGQNENRTGNLTLLMPIGVGKATYPFWDTGSHRAFPLRYRDTTTVLGLRVYRYHQRVAPIQIDSISLPGRLVGEPDRATVDLRWMYTADTDVWAEPTTGAIVQASQHADQWFADATGRRRLTVATTDIGQTPDTVRRIVDLVASQRVKLRVLEVWFPLLGPLVGLLLVATGLVLLPGAAAEPVRSRSPDEARAGSEPGVGSAPEPEVIA